MSFDTSRFTFDSWHDFLGVVMQQGRVQLDSDWNELIAELSRRIQAGTLDIVGAAVYPLTTPYAFKINASVQDGVNHITIGSGRMYVDGLLAENHGPRQGAEFDQCLAEISNTYPGAPEIDLDFTAQPYYPGASVPAGHRVFLVYLDVWRRAVTYLQRPELVDEAVGVDTTGRLQTVWQVKLLDLSNVQGGVTCSTPASSIPGWQSLTQPSAGQLSNGFLQSSQPGPCCLASNTGYTGMENQNYRVEIHQKGTPIASATGPIAYPLPAGTATFTWSRDNGSVATAVLAIAPVTTGSTTTSQLTVQSVGKDQVLGFHPNDWIEITDDYLELNGQPGELHQITGMNAAARTLTLDSPVTTPSFLVNGQIDPSQHVRITRWDQGQNTQGNVYMSDGATVWVNLTGSTGDIPVPPAGTSLILENGITVTFGRNTAFFPGGTFHTGDFWTFDARTADGWIKPLSLSPPQGIDHHYARLAMVTFPQSGVHGPPHPVPQAATALAVSDCRVSWPPSTSACPCHCTVIVRPGDITATNSLQTILNKYQNLTTETVICLMPGAYPSSAPLRCTSAHSNITLEAFQPGTAVLSAVAGQEANFADGLVVLDGVTNFSLRGLSFQIPLTPLSVTQFAGLPVNELPAEVQVLMSNMDVSIGVRPVNCTALTIEQCRFKFTSVRERDTDAKAADRTRFVDAIFGVAVFAGGQCTELRLTENAFVGGGLGFYAGFLLAPTVTLSAASLNTQNGGGLLAFKTSVAKVHSPGPAPKTAASRVLAATPARASLTAPADNIINDPVDPPWAASGGTVIPTTLDQAFFTENRFEQLTLAALVVAECGVVEFIANKAPGCTAGIWMFAPGQIVTPAADPNMIASGALALAMGYAMPQGDTTTATTIAAVPSSIRLYTGSTPYTDSQGNTWLPDQPSGDVSGGTVNDSLNPGTIAGTLPGSTDQALYDNERWGPSFSYTFNNLPLGYYQVTLKFAEIFYTNNANNVGVRVFDVSINGQQVLDDFDIAADVGALTADDQVFANVPSQGGQIVIQFTGTSVGSDQNAKISALEVDPQWTGAVPAIDLQPGATTVTGLVNFFVQLAEVAQQGFAGVTVTPLQLRVSDNEIHGLSAPALLILNDDLVQNGRTSSLVMTGNRVDAVLPFVETTVQGGLKDVGERAFFGPYIYFQFTVFIYCVTRCAVTGNMILNNATLIESATESTGRFCFYLLDGPYSSPSATVPPPEVAVMANVFQGEFAVVPTREEIIGVPLPMNDWKYFNTVVP
jgi:hypothetical protein